MVALERIPLFVLGAIGLLAGIFAGEARIGWPMPAAAADLAFVHGPLMVCAFFGTVIGLERAVALDRAWGYLGPLLSGVGGIAVIAGLPDIGAVLFALGSAIFAAMASVVLYKQRALFTLVLGLGAACWLLGTLLWLAGFSVNSVVVLWSAFLVLTIAGERLELSRFLPPSRDRAVTAPIPLALLLIAALVTPFHGPLGGILFGAGLLLLALWLVRHDIARRTIRQTGLTRFMAVCLLSGYFWLAVAGALALVYGLPEAGYVYDAILHSLFVGFVFAMVFGHAPVILPAVLRVVVPYTWFFYVPLVVLHLSVATRLLGDLLENDWLRSEGGLCNAIAIILFLLTTATLTIRATRARAQSRKTGQKAPA